MTQKLKEYALFYSTIKMIQRPIYMWNAADPSDGLWGYKHPEAVNLLVAACTWFLMIVLNVL